VGKRFRESAMTAAPRVKRVALVPEHARPDRSGDQGQAIPSVWRIQCDNPHCWRRIKRSSLYGNRLRTADENPALAGIHEHKRRPPARPLQPEAVPSARRADAVAQAVDHVFEFAGR
jgi:hypothetical protein